MHLFATDKYIDVTEKFKQDAANLKPSQFAHLPGFTLFQAISAFELGNPRMDTGIEYTTFEDDLKHIKLPQGTPEICAAIDGLFSREMAWLQGSTLVQTVLSGAFVEVHLAALKIPGMSAIDYIRTIKDNMDPLAVYVLATLKSCALAVDQILADETAIVSLEEDFHVSPAGWSLLEDIPIDVLLSLVDSARTFCKAQNLPEIGKRLELRQEWMLVLKQGITKKQGHVIRALELAAQIDETVQDDTIKADQWFTSGIQPRSDGFCLGRSIVSLPYNDAKTFFIGLLSNIRDLSKIFSLTKSADLLGFFLNFAKQDHTPLLRVLLKNMYKRQDLLGVSAKTWVERDLTELSFPNFAKVKPMILKKCKPAWDLFMAQAPLCYIDLITLLCANRCRQRQLMFESIAAWDSLHVAAQALDRALVEAGSGNTINVDNKQSWAIECSSWVYQRKLQMMLWSTLMGFEQDLFSPWERSAIYWYAKTLAVMLVEQLSRLKVYFQQHNHRNSPGYNYLVAMEVEARCMEHLCTASFLIHWVLEEKKVITAPAPKYTSRELVYGLRLECFEAMGLPQIPSYSAYEKELEVFTLDLASETAKQHLSGAQSFLKTISQAASNPEVDLLKRSAFGLTAVLIKAKSAPKSKFKAESKNYHMFFPVPVLD